MKTKCSAVSSIRSAVQRTLPAQRAKKAAPSISKCRFDVGYSGGSISGGVGMSTILSSLTPDRSTSAESSVSILKAFEKIPRFDEQEVHGKRLSCGQDGSTKHTNPPFLLVSAVSGLPSADFRRKMVYCLVACTISRFLACIGFKHSALSIEALYYMREARKWGEGKAQKSASTKFASVR
jgi:hypothetical protein